MSPGGILLVASNFPPVRGGSSAVYESLARAANGKILVVAPTHGYRDGQPLVGWKARDRAASYTIVRLPLVRPRMKSHSSVIGLSALFSAPAVLFVRARLLAVVLWLVVTKRPAAVCIGELLAGAWLVSALNAITNVPTVAYVHGEEITTTDSYDPDHARARRALLSVDRVVVVSDFTRRVARELTGEDRAPRIQLIPNGVDTERFRPKSKRPDLVERYGLAGCFVFISVCRLIRRKGVDNALRAFAEVARRYPDSRFLVVGSGPLAASLGDIAVDIGVGDRVAFAGDVEEQDLADYYCLGDVFVMPNRSLADGDTEGFGLVFLEANGCGLPVIAGRDGGSPDAVQDGVNGLLVDGTSVDQIAKAMLELREDAGLRSRLRDGGLTAAHRGDWAERARAFHDLCVSAADARKALERPR